MTIYAHERTIQLKKDQSAHFGYTIIGRGAGIPASPYEVELWKQYVAARKEIRALRRALARQTKG